MNLGAHLPDGAPIAAPVPAPQAGDAGDAGRAALDAALLRAHAAGDRTALAGLYAEAAGTVAGPAAAFYLTHAYVHALEAGDPRAAVLKRQLVDLGADIPDAP
jgi:hypothetical protein